MTTTQNPRQEPRGMIAHRVPPLPGVTASPAIRRSEPYMRLQWTDSLTGAIGYFVVHTLRSA